MTEAIEKSRRSPAVRLAVLGLLVLVFAFVVLYRNEVRYFVARLPLIRQYLGKTTVDEQAQKYGPNTRNRLTPIFAARGISYPADRIALLAFKDTKMLQVYAADPKGDWTFVTSYPILGASGYLGPKLREGDYQVPEGIYEATLEPNTPYHLALRLNYPNEIDRKRAQEENRNPGSDILIHGTTGSIGCLAMGDPVSEDLFIAAYDCNSKPIPVVIAPTDLRTQPPPTIPGPAPPWLPDLYDQIKLELQKYGPAED